MLEVRQRMDRESAGKAKTVSELPSVEMGCPVSVGEGKNGKQGRVYFIETHDGAFVKIGYSIDVPKRLDQLGVMMPGLRLLGYVPGSRKSEAQPEETEK